MAIVGETMSPLGVPLLLDGAITAGASADQIIACRPSDCLLYESPKKLRLLVEPLAGTLQVRIQVYEFAAAILSRYPTGISVISGTVSRSRAASKMLTRTKRRAVPNFAVDAHGHPQVLVMMPSPWGGGIIRHGTTGLGAANGQPAQLSHGEVWTSGTHLEWVVGTSTELGCGGHRSLQASTTDDDAIILASGGASGSNVERGTAKLPGIGFRRVDLSLWAAGAGTIAAPASAWHITTEKFCQ